MGNEHAGELFQLEQAQQLGVEVAAGDLVYRTEGFVEQEHFRSQYQRARHAAAHFHATGELLRVFVLVTAQVDESDDLFRFGRSFILWHSLQLGV